jgi:MFS family permease
MIHLQMLIDNSVVSYYLPYLLANVGITDADTKLLLNIMYALEGFIFATAGARLHDVFGRRKMLLTATAGITIALAITAGTAADYVNTGSKTSSSASIGFIFVFGAIFAFAFTSMQPIYPAEVMANDMRAKGMGTYKIVGGAAGFINTFAAPIALTNVSFSSMLLSQELMHGRSGTGSTSSSCFGISLNSPSCTSSSSRQRV